MKPFIALLVLFFCLGGGVMAQDASGPVADLGQFIRENKLHVWSGYATLGLAAATGTAAVAGWEVHPILGYSTMTSGAITLALGLTAYPQRLERVWPHALLMGLAETGWLLNAFVWEPGSLPHKITGATSLVSLGAAYVAIRLIEG